MAPPIRIERTYNAPAETIWKRGPPRAESRRGRGRRTAVSGVSSRLESLRLADARLSRSQVVSKGNAGMPLSTESRKRFTEIEEPRRLAYASLADFIPGVDPYEFMTVIEISPGPADGSTQVIMTMDSLHDETWTQRLVMGRENELENLQHLIEAR